MCDCVREKRVHAKCNLEWETIKMNGDDGDGDEEREKRVALGSYIVSSRLLACL